MKKMYAPAPFIVTGLSMFLFFSVASADIRRVSVSPAGDQGSGMSVAPYFIGPDNNFLSFSSHASNFVNGDTNGVGDAFFLNDDTGALTRLSVTAAGVQGNNYSYAGPISADGRFVTMTSHASNLVPGDTNNLSDVFRRDNIDGSITRVSTNALGAQLGEQSSVGGMSDDGRYVLLRIAQSPYVKDIQTGTLTRVDLKPNGVGTIYASDSASMSSDGRYVVFNSQAPDLVPGDNNGLNYDIFLRDIVTGSTTIQSRSSSGIQGNGQQSHHPQIRGGRYIVFTSLSTNLIPNDTVGNFDIFLRDIQTNTTQQVSVASNGDEANGHSYTPDVSADGRFVVFFSHATNLVPDDTNNLQDIFVHDVQTGATERISVAENGAQSNGDSYYPLISNDGSRILFMSDASNLVPNDTNNVFDVFSVDNPLLNTNEAPILASIGNKAVAEGETLSLTVSASDMNVGDTVALSSSDLPSGASFNAATGEFVWSPSYDQTGTYEVTFTATDDADPILSDSETIVISVSDVNRAPLLSVIGDRVVNEGQPLFFTLSATDPDGDTLSYAATNLPIGASFDAQTAIFSWTPSFGSAGNYPNVEFTVTDSGSPMELDVELITITVGDVNRAPIVSAITPQQTDEGVMLSFTVDAMDPDGDGISLSVSNLPFGAAFDTQMGVFSWTPTLSQSGSYVVTFSAIDVGSPQLTGSSDVTIIVGDMPTPVEQTVILIDTIISYDLPTASENAYMANLKKVVKFIEDGKISPAINQLNAFIAKVESDYAANTITLAERDELIGLANALLADLQ